MVYTRMPEEVTRTLLAGGRGGEADNADGLGRVGPVRPPHCRND